MGEEQKVGLLLGWDDIVLYGASLGVPGCITLKKLQLFMK